MSSDPELLAQYDATRSQEAFDAIVAQAVGSGINDPGTALTAFSGPFVDTGNHGSSVNVMMMDGSVRSVKCSIAKEVWWAIGTRSHGEVIGADQYGS